MNNIIEGLASVEVLLRDRVVYREKIDGISENPEFSDTYNTGNTSTKYVTHYKSGWKKLNYLTSEGKTVIERVDDRGVVQSRKIIEQFSSEMYQTLSVAVWNWFNLFDNNQTKQYQEYKNKM